MLELPTLVTYYISMVGKSGRAKAQLDDEKSDGFGEGGEKGATPGGVSKLDSCCGKPFEKYPCDK